MVVVMRNLFIYLCVKSQFFLSVQCAQKLAESQFSPTIQVRYRKDPHMQNSMRKLKLTLTLVLTLTDTGGAVLTLMNIFISPVR